MKRNKHHKVKKEMPESSTSHNQGQEEHDLAYYIHDRVELMHQVFSVIKYKELKAMAPACVRNISIDDLQELCTEELLGISSKRLCAILDGAEPPSDTESSSQSPTEQLETISLDSISSDEELLSQGDKSKKKKHKHRRHSSSKRKRSKEKEEDQKVEKSKASRAGLTVLELLELQARARAIRAQLQQEQTKTTKESVALESTLSAHSQSSEDEVEIKEEPAEVVEISSDEEKPNINQLKACKAQADSSDKSKTVTKHVKDLIITVPQHKTQKIKLNRSKSIAQTIHNVIVNDDKEKSNKQTLNKDNINHKSNEKSKNISNKKDRGKKKKKKRLSNASDNDEITLQLSDTEKMDLLEDLEVNSNTDSSSDSESDTDVEKSVEEHINTDKNIHREQRLSRDDNNHIENRNSKIKNQQDEIPQKIVIIENKLINNVTEVSQSAGNDDIQNVKHIIVEHESFNYNENTSKSESNSKVSPNVGKCELENENNKMDVPKVDEAGSQDNVLIEVTTDSTGKVKQTATNQENVDVSKSGHDINVHDIAPPQNTRLLKSNSDKTQISEGELSERDGSEVAVNVLKPEAVCVSDEENRRSSKKKKKKEKKSKKEKSKKKDNIESNNLHVQQSATEDLSSVNEIADIIIENTENDVENTQCTLGVDLITLKKSENSIMNANKHNDAGKTSDDVEQIPSDVEDESPNEIVEISDEVYELSDDSSNEYEMEIRNMLSKEPTASEIEALSTKIDELGTQESLKDEEIKECKIKESNEENVSWKDRYLDSKKVKRVLNTSNILNAMRKKNIQIKKKLEESKGESQTKAQDVEDETNVVNNVGVPEGSIEQYNTLLGSTKFVNPVKEIPINDTLKKDAKQLLKMYKKLLKYNDMNRKTDPSKKKKKKKKAKKGKDGLES